jgi:hypothetical protein
VNAARAVVLPATDWGAVGVYLALLLALTAATAALATWAFRSYRNTL